MTKFSFRRHRSLIILILLLLSMGGMMWFGIRPLDMSVYEKMRGIQEFYAERENRERQVERLPELREQYDLIARDENTLAILLTEDRVVDFVKVLESLASASSLEMTITSKEDAAAAAKKRSAPPKTTAQKSDEAGTTESGAAKVEQPANIMNDLPSDQYLYLSITVRGRYADIVAFLRKMETLPYGLDVVKIDVRKDEEAASRALAPGSGVSPFAMLGGNEVVTEKTVPVSTEGLEATFETVVYIKEKK